MITSCCGTAIENLSAFTEYYLKPLAQKLPSFVKDTTHLLQKIENLNREGPFPEGTLLVSWDVVSMFPNIDNNLGIKAVTDALDSREIQVPSTQCLVEAVKICLEHNNSNFQGKHFLQIHGTAMGPKNACSYADLAMGVIDQKAKSGIIKPRLWWRYRDDIFDLWTQGTTKLNDFTDFINSLYPTIKFTVVSSETSLNVLDLTLSLIDGYIQTDVYSKPTDHHMYLLRNSAHPRHCTKAIPFGVATRIRRNCSTIESYDQRSDEYQTYLVERGYNLSEVKKQFGRAKALPRENLLVSKPKDKKIVFPLVVDYNPHLPNIGKIIKSFSHLIYESPTLSEIFPKGSIIPSYRRPKNIKEILAKPKKSNYSNNNTLVGCFKCKNKCDLCKSYLVENKVFHSACTGRFYSIRQDLNCRSKNVIYLATCRPCRVQYVGSTTNEFKVRFRNHKSAMLTNKATCELAVHFNSKEHQMSDFEFIVVEKIMNDTTGNMDKVLLTREAFWCSQLCTLQPYGLNKRSEFNSKNRIRFN